MSANNPTIIASLIKEHTHVTRKPGSTPESIIKLHTALYDRFGDNRAAWRDYNMNNPDNLTTTQLDMLRKYRRRVKGCMYVRNFRGRKSNNIVPADITGLESQGTENLDEYSTIIKPGTSGGIRFVTNIAADFTDLEMLATVAVSK